MERADDRTGRRNPRLGATLLLLGGCLACGAGGPPAPSASSPGGIAPDLSASGLPAEPRTVDGLRRRVLRLPPGRELTVPLPSQSDGWVLSATVAPTRPASEASTLRILCRDGATTWSLPPGEPRWRSRRAHLEGCRSDARIELASSPGAEVLLTDLLLSPPADSLPPDLPPVLLVSLDTMRADRLESVLAEGSVPRSVERLVARATVFDRAYSTSSWTLPAHASLFSGRLPSGHGSVADPELELSARRPDPSAPSLPEILLEAGYSTRGVVAGPYLRRELGLDRGFLLYSDLWDGQKRRAEEVNRVAEAWLDDLEGRPWFLFVNYFDAHAPYDPEGWPADDRELLVRHGIDPTTFQADDLEGRDIPEEVRRLLEARYAGEIRAVLRGLGRLLDGLAARGSLDRALVIVVGDHGESFGERGQWGHGGRLYDEQARIPLWVRRPGQTRGDRRGVPVSLLRVPEWIADVAGVAWPEDGGSVPGPVVVGERRFPASWHQMLVRGDLKLLREVPSAGGPPDERWLRTGSDPAEPSAEPPPELRRALTALAEALPAGPSADGPAPGGSADRELLESLRTLGYLD